MSDMYHFDRVLVYCRFRGSMEALVDFFERDLDNPAQLRKDLEHMKTTIAKLTVELDGLRDSMIAELELKS